MENNNKQNWRELAVMQAGGAICLPILLVGSTLGQNYNFASVLTVIICGNLLLFAFGLITGFYGAKQKKSTAEFAVDLFGPYGKSFFALAMVISLIGWFGIQLRLISETFILLFQSQFSTQLIIISNICFGSIIAIGSMKGLKSLTNLAMFACPLLIATIVLALCKQTFNPKMLNQTQAISYAGLSLIISCAIAAVIDLPTFFREAKTTKDACIAASILFLIVLPLIEIAGAFLALNNASSDLVNIFKTAYSNPLWKIWVTLFIMIAGWTTNNANLYSASVSLKQLLTKTTEKGRLLTVTFFGTIVSCLPVLENLSYFLGIIGTLLSSMGAIMIVRMITQKKDPTHEEHLYNSAVWASGFIVGIITLNSNIKITTIPVIDAFLSSFSLGLAIILVKSRTIGVRNEADIPL